MQDIGYRLLHTGVFRYLHIRVCSLHTCSSVLVCLVCLVQTKKKVVLVSFMFILVFTLNLKA